MLITQTSLLASTNGTRGLLWGWNRGCLDTTLTGAWNGATRLCLSADSTVQDADITRAGWADAAYSANSAKSLPPKIPHTHLTSVLGLARPRISLCPHRPLLTPHTQCPNEAPSEAAVVAGAANSRRTVAAPRKSPRRKTSWTSTNIWTRGSRSSSMAVAKVGCALPSALLLILILPVSGTLKGYDQLMNLVLDDVKESMRGMFHWVSPLRLFLDTDKFLDDEGNLTTRSLGLIVARGTLIVLISPADGSEEIPNPFVEPEE